MKACLIQPAQRLFPAVVRLEFALVLSHALPLERGVVPPAMREERIDAPRVGLFSLLEQPRILVVGHVGRCESREADAKQPLVG